MRMLSPKHKKIAAKSAVSAFIMVVVLLFVAGVIYYKQLAAQCAGELYLYGIFPFHNAPSKEVCEGKKFVNLRTGTYQVGNLTFKIPRDYLWQGKYDEGSVDLLSLSMFYPSLQPVKDMDLHKDNLMIVLQSCEESRCIKPYTPRYYHHVIISLFKPTFTEPEYVPSLGMWKYIATEQGKPPELNEIYYKGNKENPQYWFICNVSVPNPHCVGDYWLSKGISTEVRFHYSFLNEHQKIHEAVDTKLKSFIAH